MPPACCSLPNVSPQVRALKCTCLLDISIWTMNRHLKLSMYRTELLTLQICSIQKDFPSQLRVTPFCQLLSPKIFVALTPFSPLGNHIDSTFTIFPEFDHLTPPPLPLWCESPSELLMNLLIGCILASSTVDSQRKLERCHKM